MSEWHVFLAVFKNEYHHGGFKKQIAQTAEENGSSKYILGHQNVRKLNANDYSTSMAGLMHQIVRSVKNLLRYFRK